MRMAGPFFGKFMGEFELYGTQSEVWKAGLLKRIPSSQLPPAYGGEKSWKPLPLK